MYAVGHGPIVRYALIQLTEAYRQWSKQQTSQETTVALLYASAYGSTATLAQAIARGITKAGVGVESINCEVAEPNEIRAAVEKAAGIVIGSPTLGGHAPTPIQTALGIVLSTATNNKLAGVFGSFGWSGEAIDLIESKLKDAGYRFGFETIRVKFKPTDVTLKLCEEAGTDFAQSLKRTKKLRAPRQPATTVEQAVGRIVGSLCVVTTTRGEISSAMLASWVSQATFNPPGFTVAVAKDRAIETLMHSGDEFVLNILAEGKQLRKHFIKSFTPGEDRFAGVSTQPAENGCPILNDALAYLECKVNSRMEAGDHWIIYAIAENGKVLNPDGVTAVHHRKSGSHY
jgi:flavin reductase (DIM6/NTAB) family NADH-FMN oxidoreductase RutF/flavodoxin